LPENARVSFQGSQKIGPFDIPGELARSWLGQPNPNQRPNSEVLKPSWNGLDVTRRPRDVWIIDFGTDMSEADASQYEKAFEYVVEHVKPERIQNPRPIRAKNWWRHGDPQPALRNALCGLSRHIATPEVAKHRVFVWMDKTILPDKKLIVVARSDDTTFGILQSRIHEVWALAVCTWHGVGNDPRYTPTTTFETFPFPEGLTPADTRRVGAQPPGRPVEANNADLSPGIAEGAGPLPATHILPDLADPSRLPAAEAIATAAFELNRLREAWLNPPDWVDWVITPEEEQAGFSPRPVAKPGHEAELKKRTLANLYNARPAWLAMAHERLDQAVAAAYGWDD
jgi:type II restriction/modification system DNA methylase subunit YeeA